MRQTCYDCYWCMTRHGKMEHIGCYAGSKWRKWIAKKDAFVPNECKDFKPKR